MWCPYDAQSHNSDPWCKKTTGVILNYLTSSPFTNIELGLFRAGLYLSGDQHLEQGRLYECETCIVT